MTLREFTKEYLTVKEHLETWEKPFWRKAFPTNLRFRETTVTSGYYTKWKFRLSDFSVNRDWIEPKINKELEEEWVRIHNDQIIDREWRKVYTY